MMPGQRDPGEGVTAKATLSRQRKDHVLRSDRIRAIQMSSRFGLGPTESEGSALGRQPVDWLHAQLAAGAERWGGPGWSVASIFHAMYAARGRGDRAAMRTEFNRFYREEVRPKLHRALFDRFHFGCRTEAPFVERLALFWSNHFAVSGRKGRWVAAGAVGFEHEAIRANLNRSFSQMLGDVVRHPTMLMYLDNANSIGPTSTLGRRRDRGLNENLAREILELHTVGVRGGYTQDDVQELARALTGWTIQRGRRGDTLPDDAGTFRFVARAHEPGRRRLLSQSFPEGGEEQADAMLKMLATRAETARHIATELARHFVADEPPEGAIEQIAQVFAASGGDLPSVHRAVATLAGTHPPASGGEKLKSPYDYLVSICRGVGAMPGAERWLLPTLAAMGQRPFAAPSPAGWPDTRDHWGSPDALTKRIEWALAAGVRWGDNVDARRLGNVMLAESSEGPTSVAIRRAASPGQALGLLLASPPLQWR
ncbi:MAG: DUF1800 domain-containing protein [Pseudomonadota bacterium]